MGTAGWELGWSKPRVGAGVEGAVTVGGEQVRHEREMVAGQAGKDGAQREGDEEPGTLTSVRSEEEEMGESGAKAASDASACTLLTAEWC